MSVLTCLDTRTIPLLPDANASQPLPECGLTVRPSTNNIPLIVKPHQKSAQQDDHSRWPYVIITATAGAWTSPHNGENWESLSLETAVSCLEEASYTEKPSVHDLEGILLKCRKEKSSKCALRLRNYLHENGLDLHPSVGNHLVLTLAEVGKVSDAQEIFDKLLHKSESAWNALIISYIECKKASLALDLYQEMQQDESVHPSRHTFVVLAKACSELKDMERGCKLHDAAAREGLVTTDIYLANTLINMYAKCGSVEKAQKVFDKLKVRNVVSWNALISGYAYNGFSDEALNCFEEMEVEGIPSSAVTFICVLKACGGRESINKGLRIHDEIFLKGLDRDVVVGTVLIGMYVKCTFLVEAQEVFDNLPVKNVVSWTTLILGYIELGRAEEALELFEQMKQSGPPPNATTFLCILKACGMLGAVAKGEEIHSDINKRHYLEGDHCLGTALVDMYVKCGLLSKAQNVFNELHVKDVVLWKTLIAGYIEHGYWKEAIVYLEQMQCDGVPPDKVILIYWLKACGTLGAAEKGQEIHGIILNRGLINDLVVGNALIDMYIKCGLLWNANDVFDMLPARDVVSWNALISGCSQHGSDEEALACYERLQMEGVPPDVHTFCWSLKACGNAGCWQKGQKIHAEICKSSMLESDLVVGTALVDMYTKCGLLSKAQDVFNKISVRDVVLWTVLITGYAHHGKAVEALDFFDKMQSDGISPDAITYVSCLKACASLGAVEKGQKLHGEISKEKSMGKNLLVGTALLDMYMKCGLLMEAQGVFDRLPVRDVILWNALMTGYVENGCWEEILTSFEWMQRDGFSPDVVTYVCILKACGILGAIGKGQQIQSVIYSKAYLEKDDLICNTLVDMYAKCGFVAKAQEVFDNLLVRSIISWNALIAGYCQIGELENVFVRLKKMAGEGVKADEATLSTVLNAYSHSGLVAKGEIYFKGLNEDNNIVPTLEHHTCMIGIIGRAGQIGKSFTLIQCLPVQADLVFWVSLLAICQKWGNVKLGGHAFEHAMALDAKDPSAYVCLSNIYSDAGMQEDAVGIEALRVEKTGL